MKAILDRLIQKLHLNKNNCIDLFAREPHDYFDTYGDELEPVF